MKSIFSIDVEDWFHILDVPAAPDYAEWGTLPSRVERGFTKLLDALSENRAKATCFFLGWVAKKNPHLVREAVSRGHEIASHGFRHELVYTLERSKFAEDAAGSRKALEDMAGTAVTGYRAPGFSVTAEVPWFFDELIDAGYTYDSSVFPAGRGHGGMNTGDLAPHWIAGKNGRIMEFPMTVATIFGRRVCFFGGGYLRFFPYRLVRRMAASVAREGRPVIFYIHPRELDPGQPRLPMNPLRRFKSYVNLGGTEQKICAVIRDFELTSFHDFIGQAGAATEGTAGGSCQGAGEKHGRKD